MTKGEGYQTKVHFKGKEDDFVVYVESSKIVADWKKNKSIPMTDVVNAFKIFVTHKHGAQGTFDTASKSTLENEFSTSNVDDVIKQILEKGDIQEAETSGRQGPKNDTNGPRIAH